MLFHDNAGHVEGNNAGSPVNPNALARHWQALFEFFYWKANP